MRKVAPWFYYGGNINMLWRQLVFFNIQSIMYMYVLEWQAVCTLPRGLFWSLFSELQANEGNKNTKITLSEMHKQFVTTVNKLILCYFLHDKVNPYTCTWRKEDDSHPSTLCLASSVHVLLITSQPTFDDVPMILRYLKIWCEDVKSDI